MHQTLERDHVIARLKEFGITPTQQRVEIGRVLFARPQHLSADRVMELVNDGGDKVSKATVYNTLNLFARKGMIREIIVDPTKVFYDSNTGVHHHAYNVATGELTDIDAESFGLGALPPLPEGTEAVGVDVVIRVRPQTAVRF